MRKFYSTINTVDSLKLQSLLNESSTIKEVLTKLGYPNRGNYKTLKSRIKRDNLSLDALNFNFKKWKSQNSFKNRISRPLTEILIKNSPDRISRKIKRQIIEKQLLKYECECGNAGEWLGKKIVLELDHINGINDDNRLENLRFLCPNCHSQTDTFRGRNLTVHRCSSCKMKTSPGSDLCRACFGKKCRRYDLGDEEFLRLKSEKSYTEIGKLFGVSGNAIKKRYLKLRS